MVPILAIVCYGFIKFGVIHFIRVSLWTCSLGHRRTQTFVAGWANED